VSRDQKSIVTQSQKKGAGHREKDRRTKKKKEEEEVLKKEKISVSGRGNPWCKGVEEVYERGGRHNVKRRIYEDGGNIC